MGTIIQTVTGKAFDLAAPVVEMVDALDVAWALGHTCRFNGHTRRFYSVAEHCWQMAAQMDLDAGAGQLTLRGKNLASLRLLALLHDAHEAYVGDVPSPMKRVLGPAWAEVEGRVWRVVSAALNPDGHGQGLEDLVPIYDRRMLKAERLRLMAPGAEAGGEVDWGDGDVETLGAGGFYSMGWGVAEASDAGWAWLRKYRIECGRIAGEPVGPGTWEADRERWQAIEREAVVA